MANRFKVPIRVNIDTAQVKSLMERIQGLDKRAGRGAIKKGMNEVTQAVLWAARGLVPKRSGLLRKALGRKVIVQRGGAKILGVVKPRSGMWVTKPPDFVMQRRQRTKNGKTQFFVKKWEGAVGGILVNPIRYAHLVEFGRVSVSVKSKKVMSDGAVIFGRTVKAVSPHPFMRPAWVQEEPNTVPTLHKYLIIAIQKYWAQQRAKVPRAKRT
jgi:hypothetical protein